MGLIRFTKNVARAFYYEGVHGLVASVKARARHLRPPMPTSSSLSTPLVDPVLEQVAEVKRHLDSWQFVDLQQTDPIGPDKGERASNPSFLMLVPPPERGSGGRMTMARVLRYFAAKGVTCYVVFYPEIPECLFAASKEAWLDEFGFDFCTVLRLAEAKEMVFDIAMATYWPGAYVVKNCVHAASKGYFVQDFEPYFHAPGSIAAFAEETYRLGLWGVCASPWLAETLASDYGMETAGFLLGLDKSEYFLEKSIAREDNLVVAYIRQITERRGYELIMYALKILKDRMPGVKIEIFGDAQLPAGEFLWIDNNHGILGHDELRTLYNRATVGIVTSFTNYSLIPNEMIACGCAVVDIDTPCMRAVFPPGVVALERATPQRLAEAAQSLLANRNRRMAQVQKGLKYISNISWDRSLASIHAAIEGFAGKPLNSPRTKHATPTN